MLDLVSSPSTFGEAAALWFAFSICHALADYPLQGDFLAKHKCRKYRGVPGDPPVPSGLWFHCLVAHSLIHAGFVWLITGNVWFGVAELVLHFIIDFLKGEGKTNFQIDQALHLLCKTAYVLLAYQWTLGA